MEFKEFKEFKELNGIFIDTSKFDYKNEEKEELNISEIDTNTARFEILKEKDSSQMDICKIFNPEYFIKCRMEGSKEKADQPWYMQRQILRESVLLKRLDHPTIVKFVGLNLYNTITVFDDDDIVEEKKIYTSPTLYLEYTGKKSIRYKISTKGKLTNFPLVKRQICIIGMAAAIRYLHSRNVVHRNLNPGSVWLDENLYPKIFDFSHSREFLPDETKQTNVTNNGSQQFRYQSPEVFERKINYQYLNSIDIYSLGRLMYLMLTGFEPFKYSKDNKDEKLRDLYVDYGAYNLENVIINGKFPFFPESVSENWKILLIHCWSLNPQDRPYAFEIYDLVTNEENFISTFKSTELDEIMNYIKMINEFETKKILSIQLTTEPTEVDLYENNTNENFKELDDLLKNKEVDKNVNRFFNLINDLAKTEQFYDKNYLPKVMPYVTKKLDNSAAVKRFLKIAFGDEIKIDKNIKIIERKTVSNYSGIELLNIPQKVTKICKNAFHSFKNLKRVYIPTTVKVIEENAFRECEKLTYIYLPDGIVGENLGQRAFMNCTSLDFVTIPPKLTKIRKETFKGNKNLVTIKLNKGLKKISKEAFNECSSLREITIPDSVSVIGKRAFRHCNSLKKIDGKIHNSKKAFIRWGWKTYTD